MAAGKNTTYGISTDSQLFGPNDKIIQWRYVVKEALLQVPTEEGGWEYVNIPPQRVSYIEIVENFEENLFPIMRIKLILESKVYYSILKFKDKCLIKLQINKYYTDESGVKSDMAMEYPFINDGFSLIMEENTVDVLNAQKRVANAGNYKSPTEDEMFQLTEQDNEVEFYMFKAEQMNSVKGTNTNVILNNATVTDAMGYLATEADLKNVLIAPMDNREVYDEMLIPPLKISEAYSYIDTYYGSYKEGSMTYFGLNYSYFMPYTGNCEVYAEGQSRKTVIIIPSTDVLQHALTLGELKKSETLSGGPSYVVCEYRTLDVRNESVTNDYLKGNDLQLYDSYSGTSTVYNSNARSRSDNSLNIIENKTENQYLGTAYTAQSAATSLVMQLRTQDENIDVFMPNKEFNVLFEDTMFAEQFKGKYILSSAQHIFHNDAGDLIVNTTAVVKRAQEAAKGKVVSEVKK